MTTLVVVRKNNTVAIAGDSQSTFGDTRLGASYDCASNKIFQIGDAWLVFPAAPRTIWCCRLP
jgi:ATP-dependent HslUV protease subunit HslV